MEKRYSSSKANPHVWVVTTTYNRGGELRRFLDCFSAQVYEPISLVLVDHGTDEAPSRLALPANLMLLKADPSLWWTDAVNVGIAYVIARDGVDDSDIILLQNDDSIFGPDYVSQLVWAVGGARRVVGSVAIDQNNRKVLHANLKFDNLKAKYRYLYYGSDVSDLGDSLMVSDVLKGRGVACRVEVVKEIGLLDARLPQYRSDHEWAHRAKALGIDVLVAPRAICETVLDTQARISPVRPVASYWEVLFGRRSPANFPDMVRYFYICFGPARASYCVIVNGLRTLLVSTLQLFKAAYIKTLGEVRDRKTS